MRVNFPSEMGRDEKDKICFRNCGSELLGRTLDTVKVKTLLRTLKQVQRDYRLSWAVFTIGSRGTELLLFVDPCISVQVNSIARSAKIAFGTGSSTENDRDGTGKNGQTRRSLKLAARLRRPAWRFGSASAELSQIVRILPPISGRLIRPRSMRPNSAKTYGNSVAQARSEIRMSFRYLAGRHLSVDFRESHETVEFLIGL
jgi:hypothetical protein